MVAITVTPQIHVDPSNWAVLIMPSDPLTPTRAMVPLVAATGFRGHPGYIADSSEPSGISVVNLYAILRRTPLAACHFATK